MKKYDKDGTGKLNVNELAVMLQDLAGGTPPTEEEVEGLVRGFPISVYIMTLSVVTSVMQTHCAVMSLLCSSILTGTLGAGREH